MKFRIPSVQKLQSNIQAALKLSEIAIIQSKITAESMISVVSDTNSNRFFKFKTPLENFDKKLCYFTVEAARLKSVLGKKTDIHMNREVNKLSYSSGNSSTGSLALIEDDDEFPKISIPKDTNTEFSKKIRSLLLDYTKYIDLPPIINKDRTNCISIFNFRDRLCMWSGDDFYLGVVLLKSDVEIEDLSYPIEYFSFLKTCFEKDEETKFSSDSNYIYFYTDEKILKLPVYLGENDTDKVRDILGSDAKFLFSFTLNTDQLINSLTSFNALRDNDKTTKIDIILGNKVASLKSDTTKGSMQENLSIKSDAKGSFTLDHRMLLEIVKRAYLHDLIEINIQVYDNFTLLQQSSKEVEAVWLIINWKR